MDTKEMERREKNEAMGFDPYKLIRMLEAALRFYANPESHKHTHEVSSMGGIAHVTPAAADNGARARQALGESDA